MNIEEIMNTPFKLKKGVKIEPFDERSTLYISEINSLGHLCLSTMSLNERQEAEHLDNEECSAWHFFDDIELINKPVETTNEQPKVYKAIRRVENVGEYIQGRGGFFELIELYDEQGKIVTKSLCTHPESHFSFVYEGVEYYSLPHSRGSKPVFHRLVV